MHERRPGFEEAVPGSARALARVLHLGTLGEGRPTDPARMPPPAQAAARGIAGDQIERSSSPAFGGWMTARDESDSAADGGDAEVTPARAPDEEPAAYRSLVLEHGGHSGAAAEVDEANQSFILEGSGATAGLWYVGYSQGHPYYLHEPSGHSQWEDPRQPALQAEKGRGDRDGGGPDEASRIVSEGATKGLDQLRGDCSDGPREGGGDVTLGGTKGSSESLAETVGASVVTEDGPRSASGAAPGASWLPGGGDEADSRGNPPEPFVQISGTNHDESRTGDDGASSICSDSDSDSDRGGDSGDCSDRALTSASGRSSDSEYSGDTSASTRESRDSCGWRAGASRGRTEPTSREGLSDEGDAGGGRSDRRRDASPRSTESESQGEGFCVARQSSSVGRRTRGCIDGGDKGEPAEPERRRQGNGRRRDARGDSPAVDGEYQHDGGAHAARHDSER